MMKYQLKCIQCGNVSPGFATWFEQDQTCPKCGSKHSEVEYQADYTQLKALYKLQADSFWHYFDYLPLEKRENIVSCREGAIPIESWDFLSDYARENHGIECRALVYRNDLNGGTQTFKDVAGSMAASLFKEQGVRQYCIASTGNTATAYAKYLSLAGIAFKVFVPATTNEDSIKEILSYGQEVVRSQGDYAQAKKEAADYARQNKVLISAGNFDPIRVEAKKTMVFEFMRQLGKMPDVYIQAVAGGTGPIAIDKGVREIERYYPEVTLPRMLLVQQDLCDPMVQAWELAVKEGFPKDYHKNYPVIDNPQTRVSILSTGNPGMYPVIAPIVRKSGGSFLRISEEGLPALAREVCDQRGVSLGPASIVCLAGFYRALAEKRINQGDTVLINCGEGVQRAAAFHKEVMAVPGK
ncbi:MAG: pyridoxal-phosphate dependent enzyme [Bacteroidales bacterium]|jgi:threonine synthase|nr:pyridoxal-phosphate dependent enzyme [Bacteroidales bacterium]